MEPGLVLATIMNLEVQIEHILDVGFTMLEDVHLSTVAFIYTNQL